VLPEVTAREIGRVTIAEALEKAPLSTPPTITPRVYYDRRSRGRRHVVEDSPGLEDARYADVRQYSLAQILGVWAAAALPMGVLAWVVASWLRDQLGGKEPLAQALLILLTLGLVWQFVLVLILTWRELGTLSWSRVRNALWLRAPRDPKSGRVGGRIWLWLLPFILLFALEQALPAISGPIPRDFGRFLGDDRGKAFFEGAWGWFAVVIVLSVFNTVLGEELLFRGLLLPRMRGVLESTTGSPMGCFSASTTCTSCG
jgi:membrane protease YdiL (CAAX protease family)